jgi:hypothetical protein
MPVLPAEFDRLPARIGTLELTYADPAVDVTTEQRTVEHETIDDSIVVQFMGRRPDQLSIEGVVPEYEVPIIDDLTKQDFEGNSIVEIRTERWAGQVLVESTNTSFRREKSKEGVWLYDFSIEALEVSEQDFGNGLDSRLQGSRF